MSLLSRVKISVISYDGAPLPRNKLFCEITANEKIFIGRGAANSLVLEDPSRIISRIQACIVLGGADSAEVTNLSSSTSFFINATEVFPGETRALCCGDNLLIGTYVLELSKVAEEKSLIPENANQPFALLDTSHDKGVIASSFIPDDIDFFTANDGIAGAIAPSLSVNDDGSLQEFTSSDMSLLQSFDAPVEQLLGHLLKENDEAKHAILAGDHLSNTLLNDVSKPVFSSALLADLPISAPRPAKTTSDNPGLNHESVNPESIYRQSASAASLDDSCRIAFANALQVDVKKIPVFTPEFFQQLGDVLLHLTAGTVNMMHERAQIKHEMRAEVTIIAPSGNNPLKFAPDANTAITHLLGEPIPGFMPAKTAIDDAFDDLLAHQIGLMSGARAAVYDVVKNFSPGKIQKYLATKNIIESLMPMAKKARLWELYEVHYGEVAGSAREEFEMRFQQAFALAYEHEIDKMCEARELA